MAAASAPEVNVIKLFFPSSIMIQANKLQNFSKASFFQPSQKFVKKVGTYGFRYSTLRMGFRVGKQKLLAKHRLVDGTLSPFMAFTALTFFTPHGDKNTKLVKLRESQKLT